MPLTIPCNFLLLLFAAILCCCRTYAYLVCCWQNADFNCISLAITKFMRCHVVVNQHIPTLALCTFNLDAQWRKYLLSVGF